jgi:hypothetical protein
MDAPRITTMDDVLVWLHQLAAQAANAHDEWRAAADDASYENLHGDMLAATRWLLISETLTAAALRIENALGERTSTPVEPGNDEA